jgi:hypothetical protein
MLCKVLHKWTAHLLQLHNITESVLLQNHALTCSHPITNLPTPAVHSLTIIYIYVIFNHISGSFQDGQSNTVKLPCKVSFGTLDLTLD